MTTLDVTGNAHVPPQAGGQPKRRQSQHQQLVLHACWCQLTTRTTVQWLLLVGCHPVVRQCRVHLHLAKIRRPTLRPWHRRRVRRCWGQEELHLGMRRRRPQAHLRVEPQSRTANLGPGSAHRTVLRAVLRAVNLLSGALYRVVAQHG